ncbi:myb/SANT-like DNA-binding domain-containing protein 1 isoform X1 [Anguilla anguilla]|uniref:myb/SANT-like DNA-binding domain-containing protein 1 isoform X1 n=1 Tax=Anguilla anguilla TaxID=7936 RepID=UPI0015AE1B62|nr:myb/SANT-like DNA-binding domain-containing protein 1 isoform X1 [Anguilla anguilla]
MAADECYSYIVPGQSEKHRRARNWTDSEMKGLVYVWEEYVTELRKAKRNAKIYEKMAKRFYELTGEHRHREEIKMKITNMTFQYRQVKMKCMSNGGSSLPEWPFFKAIDKILSKVPDPGRQHAFDFQQSGPSTSHTEASPSLPATSPTGLLPEYTGSSDERERQEEAEGSETSGSLQSQESRSQPVAVKRKRVLRSSLKKKKLKVMEAMLQEQRKVSRAVEETCREVRRVMHQQNFLQVQSLQLQERMMNLLEKMISPPVQPAAWPAAGIKEPGHGQA